MALRSGSRSKFQQPFDPITAILFKMIQALTFFFVLAVMFMNPVAKKGIIDPKADDLRIYPLPRRIDAVWYGKPVLIDGVLLGGAEWTRLTMPTPGVYLGDVPAAGSDRDE